MAKAKPGPAQPTKKQLSRRHREEKQLRLIWMITGATSALIVIILILGLVLQNTQVVASVNGEKIRLSDYQKRARFEYYYLINAGVIQEGAIDQLSSTQRESFFKNITDEMVNELLVRQEAQKLGLTVSAEEVQTEIEQTWFQHYRIPPTPTPTPTIDPQSTPTPTVDPAATPTPEVTPSPTATPDTEEAFQARYQEFTKNVLKRSGISEQAFRRIVETGLLKNKLQKALITDIPTEEEQVWLRYIPTQNEEAARLKIQDLNAGVETQVHARHILVATQAEAEQVINRLKEGEDFATLAAELSTDTSNKDQGGDLGWFGRGQMVAEFEKAAFNGEIGLYPFPVKTSYGFHVLEILGKEERPIDREKAMYDLGWNSRDDLDDRFGPLFTEAAFSAEIGLIQEPVPTEYNIAVVEVLGHEIRQLSEAEQEQRRAKLFQSKLDEIRKNADIRDFWGVDMIPRL